MIDSQIQGILKYFNFSEPSKYYMAEILVIKTVNFLMGQPVISSYVRGGQEWSNLSKIQQERMAFHRGAI